MKTQLGNDISGELSVVDGKKYHVSKRFRRGDKKVFHVLIKTINFSYTQSSE